LVNDVAPISVVIPAFNAESFIGDAIRSVLAQTLRPAEIIVIADDCTDRTKQIATELGATVLEQKRRNMAAGLNLGIRATSQPWIALLDADDIWEKDKIALQWEAAEACPEVAIVSCTLCTLCNGEIIASKARALRERWQDGESVAISRHGHYFAKVEGDFLVRFNIQTTTVLLRRDVFSVLGDFDESLLYGQTFEFFARVLARYPLAFVDKPLVYVRVHNANHTRNVEASLASHLSIVNRMLKNPDLYPPGSGEAHREVMKSTFLRTQRFLAQQEAARSTEPLVADRRSQNS